MGCSVLQASVTDRGLVLDPRTKILMLLNMAVFVLGSAGGGRVQTLTPLFCAMPAVLLLSAKKWKTAITYIILFSVSYWGYAVFGDVTTGFLHYFLLGCCGILARFLPSIMMGGCGGTLFNNFTITSDGYYYFDYYSWGYPHLDEYSKVTKSKECPFPWWSLYGTPTEDIVDTVIDAPVAVGEDDDGNTIEFYLTSDGVVYEGDTYNYNDDNIVTINGDTYNITVDYSTVDPDYYEDFVGDTINNYYNYYTTEGTDYDDTDILTALKSLHISLESFGSDTYRQLKKIITQLTALPNQINSSLQTQADRIIKAIEKLNNSIENLDLSTEEQKEKEKLSWLEAIAKVKKKFCVDEIQANILTCYNAMFNATYSDSGGSTVATYSMATVASDSNGNTSVITNSVTTGFIPSITISFMGESYNLLSSLHSSVWGTYINMAKKLISALLTIAFFIGLYRSLPSIIGGVAGVVVESPQFQEFHNNAELNYYKSKYDK